jgi:hypothetical protein
MIPNLVLSFLTLQSSSPVLGEVDERSESGGGYVSVVIYLFP